MDLDSMIELANMLNKLLNEGYHIKDYIVNSDCNHIIVVYTVNKDGKEEEFFFFLKRFQ